MKIDFYQSQLKLLNSEKENNNYKKGKYCAHSSDRAALDLCPEGLLRTLKSNALSVTAPVTRNHKAFLV